MCDSDRNRGDQAILSLLKKTSFKPAAAVNFLINLKSEFLSSSMTDEKKSSFFRTLINSIEKIMKRNLSEVPSSDILHFFRFLVEIIDFSLSDLENFSMEKLEILVNVLNPDCKFYNPAKNPHCQNESFWKEFENLLNEKDDFICFGFNRNLFLVIVIALIWKNERISSLGHLAGKKIAFDYILASYELFSSVKEIIRPQVWNEKCFRFLICVNEFCENLKEDGLRFVQKDGFKNFIGKTEVFSKKCMNELESARLSELLELNLAFNLLDSPYLDKKLIGADELVRKVHQIRKREENRSSPSSSLTSFDKPTRYLTKEIFSSWVKSKQLLQTVYSGTFHTEVIKKFTDIVKYLYSINQIGTEVLDLIWENSFSRHTSYKEVHLGVILDLIFTLEITELKFILSKIEKLDNNNIDVNVMKILKQFNFVQHKFVDNDADGFKYLKILWNLCERQGGLRLGTDGHLKAVEYFVECIKANSARSVRMEYAEKCVEVIKGNGNVEGVLMVLKSVFEAFPSEKSFGVQTLSRKEVLEKIQVELMKSLFYKIYISKFKFIENHHIPESFKEYEQSINMVLSFIKFLLKIDKDILPFSNIKKLWDVFVVNRVTKEEQDLFYYFLNSLISSEPVIPQKLMIQCFTDLILHLPAKAHSLSSYSCYEKHFLKISQLYSHLTLDSSDLLLSVQNPDLISLPTLWNIVLFSKDDIVFLQSSTLLQNLFKTRKNFSDSDQESFVSRCFSFISSLNLSKPSSSNTVLRCIQLVSDFSKSFNWQIPLLKLQSQQQSFEFTVLIKSFVSKSRSREEFEEVAYNTTLWQSFKEIIASRVNRDLQKLSFVIDGKNVWGESGKTLEDLNLDKFRTVEVREIENLQEFDEHLAQLKMIFEHLDVEIIKLALQKEGNNLDEVVSLLTNEDVVAVLRSESCEQFGSLQVVEERKNSESAGMVERGEGGTKIIQFISQNEEFLKVFYKLSVISDQHVLGKVVEFMKTLDKNKNLKERIKNFEVFEDIFNTSNLIRFWNHLDILLYLLNEKNDNLAENFFETGGLFNLMQILIAHESSNIIPTNRLSEEIIRTLIEITNFYLNNFPANLNFEDLVEPIELATTLISLTSSALSSDSYSESMIESALSLLMKITSHNPSMHSNIYKDPVFSTLIQNILPQSQQASLRSKIVDTIRTLVQTLGQDCSQYFWNLLSTNIPINKGPQLKDYFFLLSIILETNPFVSLNFINNCISIVTSSGQSEGSQQDLLLTGYLELLTCLLKNFNSDLEGKLLKYTQSALFQMNTFEDFGKDFKDLPIFKHVDTRKSAFRLLELLLAKHGELKDETLKMIAGQHLRDKLIRIYNYENQKKENFVGLRNFGCTCYLNSSIQQLFMIFGFCGAVLDANLDRAEDLEDNVLYQMQVILGNLKFSKKQCFEPIEFCKAFKDYEGSSINVKIQQDADEFLSLLFDKLEEKMKLTGCESFIRNVIGGEFIHQIRSTEPNFPYYGTREEHFFRISLDIRNLKTLNAAFDQYTSEELLEGDNKYLCEEHNTKVNASKRCLLGRLENTIIVHLKRFEYNYQESRRIKINDRFEFPEELNLKKWSIDSNKPENYYDYTLSGVIVHSGVADSGHYFSIIRDRTSQKWFKFDDRYVQPYDFSSLNKDCFGKDSGNNLKEFEFEFLSNAYMLVYERKSFIVSDSQYPVHGVNLARDIEKNVVSENIEFIQDSIYFEESYEDFIMELVRKNEICELNDEYDDDWADGRLLDLGKLKLAGNVAELISFIQEPKKKVQISIQFKLLRSCFIYSLELLIKAEKTDRFLKISSTIFNLILKSKVQASWVLDLIRTNKVLFFTLMNSVYNDLIRTNFTTFLMNCLEKSLDSEQDLFEKVALIDDSIFKAQPFEPISSYIETVYKLPASRFINYLMTNGINSFKNLHNVEVCIFNCIQGLSERDDVSRLLVINGTIYFVVNFYNLPIQHNENRIHATMKNLMSSVQYDEDFVLDSCCNYEIFSSSQFMDLMVKNLEIYSNVLKLFLMNAPRIQKVLIKSLCERYGRNQNNLQENWKVLENLALFISMNSANKRNSILQLFEPAFGSFNKVSFFEDILIGIHFTDSIKSMLVIWWGELMSDEEILSYSQENGKKLMCFLNVKFDSATQLFLERAEIKNANQRFLRCIALVKNF